MQWAGQSLGSWADHTSRPSKWCWLWQSSLCNFLPVQPLGWPSRAVCAEHSSPQPCPGLTLTHCPQPPGSPALLPELPSTKENGLVTLRELPETFLRPPDLLHPNNKLSSKQELKTVLKFSPYPCFWRYSLGTTRQAGLNIHCSGKG